MSTYSGSFFFSFLISRLNAPKKFLPTPIKKKPNKKGRKKTKRKQSIQITSTWFISSKQNWNAFCDY
jgi:hypothetical protein